MAHCIRLLNIYTSESLFSSKSSYSGRYLTGTITTISNIADLLRQPGGCGEQSLISFAPNVEILKFLKATDPTLSPQQEKSYRDLLQRGIIPVMSNRNNPSLSLTRLPASSWISKGGLRRLCCLAREGCCYMAKCVCFKNHLFCTRHHSG